jgi:uncharacterized repeat protein (TIGR03803 family)
MFTKKLSFRLILAWAIAVVTLMTTTRAAAQEESVLYSFDKISEPYAGLIFDASGNLYGTTLFGGDYGYGSVFELLPQAGGGWSEQTLHSFTKKGGDGFYPVAGLVLDAAGNLYGTAQDGGAYQHYGIVFELVRNENGSWDEEILHSFNLNGRDGVHPLAGLIFDAAGNLYGTTSYGGIYANGTVFELLPKPGGRWGEKIVHNFFNNFVDGVTPYAGLIFDASGNLYGTTTVGGAYCSQCGTVFKLARKPGGDWSEEILHSFNFNGADGVQPYGGLVFDPAGNLYGTTANGGVYNEGTVFELSTAAGGRWSEKILHDFSDAGTDGAQPLAGLILDAAGNLYGTTSFGGASGEGTVFELLPSAGGSWTEETLHSFLDNGVDGDRPYYAPVVFDAWGNLYGTTYAGGSSPSGGGAVFEVTP